MNYIVKFAVVSSSTALGVRWPLLRRSLSRARSLVRVSEANDRARAREAVLRRDGLLRSHFAAARPPFPRARRLASREAMRQLELRKLTTCVVNIIVV